MKQLFIEIRNSLKYQEANEEEKKNILTNWQNTPEAKALRNKKQ